MNDQRFYSYYQTARSAVFKGLTHCQRLFPYGLALLLLALLLWDRWLSFTCCRLVWTIATLASLGIICQQQHHTKQLTQHLQVQMRAEKLYQQAITDLELAITQRGQAQVHLAHQATLLRSFLDTSPDLLYCCNEANQLFNCNRAMELLIGKSQQQLMGLTPQDLYPKTIAQQDIETNRQLFQTNRAVTYEQWLPYPDGRQAYFEIRKVPFYDRVQQQRGLLGFGRDITDHKDAQIALEQANLSKSHFMATISHELRTPLSGIVGLSRLIREGNLDQALQQRYLKTIYLSALTLNHIVNDIVSLDKIEQQRIQLLPEALSLSSFLEELVDLGKTLVESKGLLFTLQLGPDLPQWIIVDGTRLRQILWNLLSNAVKFTSAGEVTLRVYFPTSSNTTLHFAVTDSGIGISASEQSKIFAMYYQVKGQPGLNNPMGAGIGLALSKQLATLMGGDLTVHSLLGKGSCFTLKIPSQPSLALPEIDSIAHLPSLKAIQVLLVEDTEINITIAEALLKQLGCQVDIATTGEQALAKFSFENHQLVLVDIRLPDMNGFELVKQLRKAYPNKPLPPLVALTAQATLDLDQYQTQGMDAFLQKPLSIENFMAIIKQYLPESFSKQSSENGTLHPPAAIIDFVILKDYLSLLGAASLANNITLLETTLPNYLSTLKAQLEMRQPGPLREIAHKIQGACGSMGLQRLQQLALQIEQAVLPDSWQLVAQKVNQLSQQWLQDVEYLKNWLKKQGC